MNVTAGFRVDRTAGEPIDLSVARSPQMRALMLLAHTLDGWRVHAASNGIQFDCKHPGVSFRFPSDDTLRNSVFTAKTKTICRHAQAGPLVRSADMAHAISDMVKLDRSTRQQFVKAVVSALPPDSAVIAELAEATGQPVELVEFDAVETHFPQLRPQPVDDVEPPTPAPAPTSPPVRRSRRPVERSADRSPGAKLVSSVPFRAHQGGKRTYSSKATIERCWSDGSVDYACALCDFEAATPQSVAGHQKLHRTGPWVRPEADGYDPDWVPTPRVADRVDRLAAELCKAFDAGYVTPDAIARFVVAGRVAARQAEDDDTPSELTPEQVLARIARLVDRGETPRLQARVDELAVEVEMWAESAKRSERRAEHAESALRTLRDLLNDEVRDEAPGES